MYCSLSQTKLQHKIAEAALPSRVTSHFSSLSFFRETRSELKKAFKMGDAPKKFKLPEVFMVSPASPEQNAQVPCDCTWKKEDGAVKCDNRSYEQRSPLTWTPKEHCDWEEKEKAARSKMSRDPRKAATPAKLTIPGRTVQTGGWVTPSAELRNGLKRPAACMESEEGEGRNMAKMLVNMGERLRNSGSFYTPPTNSDIDSATRADAEVEKCSSKMDMIDSAIGARAEMEDLMDPTIRPPAEMGRSSKPDSQVPADDGTGLKIDLMTPAEVHGASRDENDEEMQQRRAEMNEKRKLEIEMGEKERADAELMKVLEVEMQANKELEEKQQADRQAQHDLWVEKMLERMQQRPTTPPTPAPETANASPPAFPAVPPQISDPPPSFPAAPPQISEPPSGFPAAPPQISAPPPGFPATAPQISAPPPGFPTAPPQIKEENEVTSSKLEEVEEKPDVRPPPYEKKPSQQPSR